MTKFVRTITIHAPVEKVFKYMADPVNLPEIWPSMIEVKEVTRNPQGVVNNFGWVYKMAGVRFEGASETTAYIENECNTTKSTRGIQSVFVWSYEPENGNTKLTVEVEYTIPVPVLGKLAESFIVKQNEHEAEVLLANLKVRMET